MYQSPLRRNYPAKGRVSLWYFYSSQKQKGRNWKLAKTVWRCSSKTLRLHVGSGRECPWEACKGLGKIQKRERCQEKNTAAQQYWHGRGFYSHSNGKKIQYSQRKRKAKFDTVRWWIDEFLSWGHNKSASVTGREVHYIGLSEEFPD